MGNGGYSAGTVVAAAVLPCALMLVCLSGGMLGCPAKQKTAASAELPGGRCPVCRCAAPPRERFSAARGSSTPPPPPCDPAPVAATHINCTRTSSDVDVAGGQRLLAAARDVPALRHSSPRYSDHTSLPSGEPYEALLERALGPLRERQLRLLATPAAQRDVPSSVTGAAVSPRSPVVIEISGADSGPRGWQLMASYVPRVRYIGVGRPGAKALITAELPHSIPQSVAAATDTRPRFVWTDNFDSPDLPAELTGAALGSADVVIDDGRGPDVLPRMRLMFAHVLHPHGIYVVERVARRNGSGADACIEAIVRLLQRPHDARECADTLTSPAHLSSKSTSSPSSKTTAANSDRSPCLLLHNVPLDCVAVASLTQSVDCDASGACLLRRVSRSSRA